MKRVQCSSDFVLLFSEIESVVTKFMPQRSRGLDSRGGCGVRLDEVHGQVCVPASRDAAFRSNPELRNVLLGGGYTFFRTLDSVLSVDQAKVQLRVGLEL